MLEGTPIGQCLADRCARDLGDSSVQGRILDGDEQASAGRRRPDGRGLEPPIDGG